MKIRFSLLLVLTIVATFGFFFAPLIHATTLSSFADDLALTSLDSNFNVLAQATLCNGGAVNCVVGTYTCGGNDHAILTDCSVPFVVNCVGDCWNFPKTSNPSIVGPTNDQIWFMDYAQSIVLQVISQNIHIGQLGLTVYFYALDANGAKQPGSSSPYSGSTNLGNTFTFTSPSADTIASTPSYDGKYGLYIEFGDSVIFNTNFKVMFGPRLTFAKPNPSVNLFELSLDCLSCSRPEFSGVFLEIRSQGTTTLLGGLFPSPLAVTIPNVVTLNPPDASTIPITELTNVHFFPATTQKVHVNLSYFEQAVNQIFFSVDLAPGLYSNFPAFFFDLAPPTPFYPVFSPTTICQNGGGYNSYTGACVCPVGFVGDLCELNQSDVCVLKCPTHMVPDSKCSQCVCTTQQCSINTRSFLVKLQNNFTFINQVDKDNFGPSGVFSHLLPRELDVYLGLNRSTPKTTGFSIPFDDIESLPSFVNLLFAPSDDDLSPPVGLEEAFVSIPRDNDNPTGNAAVWLSQYPNYDGPAIVTISTRPFVHHSTIRITEKQIQARFTTLAKRLEYRATSSNVFPNSQTNPSSLLPFPPPTPLNQPFISARCTFPSPSTDPTTFACPTPTETASPLWNCQSDPQSLVALNGQCTFLSSFPIPSTMLENCLGMYSYMQDTCANRPTLPSNLATFSFSEVSFKYTTQIASSISNSLPITISWTLNQEILPANQYAMSIGIYVTIDGYMTKVLVKTVQAVSPTQNARFIIPTKYLPEDPNFKLTVSVAIIQNYAATLKPSSKLQFLYQTSANPFGVQCTRSTAVINSSTVELSVVDPITHQCSCSSGYVHEYWFDSKNAIPLTNDISTFDPSVTSLTTQYDPTLYECVEPCYSAGTAAYASNVQTCTCKTGFVGAMCAGTTECGNKPAQLGTSQVTVHSECNNVGMQDCNSKHCRCYNQYNGEKCQVCDLTSVCDSKGTKSTTDCEKCICNTGFYTPTCGYRSMHGSLDFIVSKPASNSTLAPTPSPSAIQAMIRDLSSSMSISPDSITLARVRYVHDVVMDDATKTILRCTFEFGSSTSSSPLANVMVAQNDVSDTNIEHFIQEFNDFYHQVTVLSTSTSSTSTSPATSPPIGDLYDLWNGLQQSFPSTPVYNNPELNKEVGPPAPALPPAYDANCDASAASNNCPSGADPFVQDPVDDPFGINPGNSDNNTSTATIIIIAVVVPVVVVCIILLLVGLWCCKSKQALCFKPKKRKSGKNQTNQVELGGAKDSHTATSPSASSDTTNVGRSQFVTESGAIDLTEIELNPGEKELPVGWKKMRHNVTGHTMYVNANNMQSQRQSPVATNTTTTTTETNAETYGEGW